MAKTVARKKAVSTTRKKLVLKKDTVRDLAASARLGGKVRAGRVPTSSAGTVSITYVPTARCEKVSL